MLNVALTRQFSTLVKPECEPGFSTLNFFSFERIQKEKKELKCFSFGRIQKFGFHPSEQVSISPTIYEQLFCMKVFCATFLYLQFGFINFWQKEIGAKVVHKLPVKLTRLAFLCHCCCCFQMRMKTFSKLFFSTF